LYIIRIVVEFVVDDDYAQPFDENEDMGMEGQNEGENEAQFKDYDDSVIHHLSINTFICYKLFNSIIYIYNSDNTFFK
jgi:hypothetical protein